MKNVLTLTKFIFSRVSDGVIDSESADNNEPLWLNINSLQKTMSSKKAYRRLSINDGFSIELAFKPKNYEGQCLRQCVPLSVPTYEHPTVKFIKETADGIDLEKTTLFNQVVRGQIHKRYIPTQGGRIKIKLNSDSLRLYQKKVLEGLSFTRLNGIQPLERGDGPKAHSKNDISEKNIGVAVIGGEVYFYRTGHHRVGYALALGIDKVPCNLLLWDKYYEELPFVDRIKLIGAK